MATYKNYTITPISVIVKGANFEFVHKDYDGSPDGGDYRCGHGETLEDCKEQIDEKED